MGVMWFAERSIRLAFALTFVATFCMTSLAAPNWAEAVFPSGAHFSLEIAADAESIQRGYMFREKIGKHEGMLFVFPRPDTYGFWMKNCVVSLDIIWLDDDFRVVEIAHDRQPCPEEGDCPVVSPMRAASFVLEVAAGTARREGLKPGDRITVMSELEFP